jgi:hypothetical protein
MVGMVVIKLIKSLVEVKAIKAVAINSVKVLIRFIVIN